MMTYRKEKEGSLLAVGALELDGTKAEAARSAAYI
ncbi:hypothetical protein BSG1_01440 [Bacillus sp. SG-1]|nr:hypothetical protein BSG1_01440 [Bacillus sp. SG-1]